jgi:hypothetical protein
MMRPPLLLPVLVPPLLLLLLLRLPPLGFGRLPLSTGTATRQRRRAGGSGGREACG